MGVLWYTGYMFNNLYRMSTATTINNSGLGDNALTKPAGVETASIMPGKKYSVYIPSVATFTTDFNTDGTNYSIGLYTKPEIGEVLSVDGNTITFTGHSYRLSNASGEFEEIGVSSHRAQLVVFTHSEFEAGMYIDWSFVAIPASTTDNLAPVEVSILAGGGVVDHVFASRNVIRGQELSKMLDTYLVYHDSHPDTATITDDSREFVIRRVLIDSTGITLPPGGSQNIPLYANDPFAFKVEYEMKGGGLVMVNGMPAESGYSSTELPEDIDIYANSQTTIQNLSVTEYYSTGVIAGAIADFDVVGATGTPMPVHLHDDNSLTRGTVTVTPVVPAAAISGWFKVADGDVIPGVTMAGGVLTGSDLYVNGKPYTGSALRDWYFLTKVSPVSEAFDITVPVHSLTVSELAPTAAEIDDLYELAFGNATVTAPADTISISELPTLMLATEWNILTSG